MSESGSHTPAQPVFVVPEALASLGVVFRPEVQADLPFLERLYLSTRWNEFAGFMDDGQKTAFLRDQFRLQRRHYLSHYDASGFFVVELAGQPMGRLYLYGGTATDVRVVDISLLPEHRGCGLGGAMLCAVQSQAVALGKAVSLHVDCFNPAKRLYERLGFREVKQIGASWLMEWRSL